MREEVLKIGEPRTYIWKHIKIDYSTAMPILWEGKEVGAFLAQPMHIAEGIKVMEMHGIEVYPEYRHMGIATAVVNMLMQQCDMLIGAITEDQPKPFWLNMAAQFRSIPLDAFGKTLDTVHTDDPVFFFITKNPRAAKYAEMYAVEVPKIMRQFNKLPLEKQREFMLQR